MSCLDPRRVAGRAVELTWPLRATLAYTGSAQVEGPPAAARPSSLPTAHLDPSFFADVFPLPGPFALAVRTSGSADGTATFQELSKAPVTAGKPTPVGKQKENHFLGVEVPAKNKERAKSKTKTKRAKATEVKSAAIVEDSDDEAGSVPTRKVSSASRRARSRSASTGSRAPSVPTDYDEQPPHVKAARPKKSRAIADSEEEDEEGVVAQHVPTTAGSNVSRTTSKRARSNSVASEASAAPKSKRRQSRAISEDGDDEWMRAMEAANEKAEDEDSDFGDKGGAAKKGKGKGKKEKAKKEKAPAKEKKARTPRVKKGAAPVEPQPQPSTATTTSEEPATATGSTSAAPLPPARVADPQPNAIAVVEEDEDEEEPVVAPPQRKTSKKARVVLESDDAPIAEDSDHVGASTGNSKDEEAIKSKTTRKRVAPSSDEDDGDTPAATEEIASVDDNSPVKSGKRSRTMSKGKGKAKTTSSSTSAPAPLPTIAAGPGRRTSSATAAERMDAVMRMAEEGPEESLLLPPAAREGSGPSQVSANKSDDEAVKVRSLRFLTSFSFLC